MPFLARIVLTGGPCGGKTTFQARIAAALAAQGVRTVRLPEVATLVLNSGLDIGDFRRGGVRPMQKAILRTQLALEESLAEATRVVTGPVVMLLDRGALDGKAYCEAPDWDAILAELGLAEEGLLARYDLVLHLVSTADGAVEHYSMASNPARFEDCDTARNTDRLLREAWRAHPRLYIVDNDGGCEAKMDRADGIIRTFLADRSGG